MFCSSIDLHRISFVRASGEMFRTCVFDALDVSYVGESIRRRPVLLGLAPLCASYTVEKRSLYAK